MIVGRQTNVNKALGLIALEARLACTYRKGTNRLHKKEAIDFFWLKQDVINRENSVKTKSVVPSAIQHSKRLHYDKVSKVSFFPTRFRRYVENFLELDIKNINLIKNKKVLVIDDTFGEGLTMCEISRILEPYTTSVIGFTIMKDISQK